MSSGGREEHIDWITGALAGLGVEGHARDDWAPRLYDAGVRVLGPDEVILSRADARLLDHVRQAAQRWEEKKREARAQPKFESWVPSKEDQILAAMRQLGGPATKNTILSTAAGHMISGRRFYPWRDAFLELVGSGRIEAVDEEPGAFRQWVLVESGSQ